MKNSNFIIEDKLLIKDTPTQVLRACAKLWARGFAVRLRKNSNWIVTTTAWPTDIDNIFDCTVQGHWAKLVLLDNQVVVEIRSKV